MELQLEIVKPNLHILGDEVYFAFDHSDVVSVSRSVDDVIKEHIGELKVKEADIEVMGSGKSVKAERKYTAPLRKYLDVVVKQQAMSGERLGGITSSAARLFGLSYVINSATLESLDASRRWLELQRGLADPNKLFDTLEERYLALKVDRYKTLERMKKGYQDLDPKMPDNYAEFVVTHGEVPFGESTLHSQFLGVVSLLQLKARNKEDIEKAKLGLVDKLRNVEGPCLSFDAPQIYGQMMELYEASPELIRRYGDVLKSSWRERVFRA